VAADTVKRREFDKKIASQLHAKPLAGRVLAGRGIRHSDEVRLHNKQLPSPDTLADFDKAVCLLTDAITQQKKILIVGDYDADGATSTALATQ